MASGSNTYGNNIDAGVAAGEFLGPCADSSYDYAVTVWYSFTAPTAGTITAQAVGLNSNFDANAFDPNLAVFPASSISAPIACNDDSGGLSDASVTVGVTAGQYRIQVGGVYDPARGAFYDEGDFNLLTSFTAAPPVPPPTLLEAEVRKAWVLHAGKRHNKTKIGRFKLTTETGSTLQIRCKKDCHGIRRYAQHPRTVFGTSLDLKRLFGSNKLLATGTKIQLWVTKAGEIGRFWKFEVRLNQPPKARKCQIQLSGALTNCKAA